jgi:hypothetical protein
MSDMLVKLYELPPLQPALDAIRETGIEVRPARVGEEYVIGPWVQRQFNKFGHRASHMQLIGIRVRCLLLSRNNHQILIARIFTNSRWNAWLVSPVTTYLTAGYLGRLVWQGVVNARVSEELWS